MKDTLVEFIDRTLDTRVTPLAYVFALTGIVWGFAFTFLSSDAGVTSTVLFQAGALVGVSLWGISVLVSSLLLLYGLATKSVKIVTFAAFILFIAWSAGAISYGMTGEWILRFPLAIVNILCYGYYYLAASLDRLWDYSPVKDEKV
jgi:hypothetical protein